MLAGHFGIEAIVEDIAPALEGLGCYRRQVEAIRTVVPGYGDGWKCKLVLPSILESDRLNITRLTVQSPAGEVSTVRLTPEIKKQIRPLPHHHREAPGEKSRHHIRARDRAPLRRAARARAGLRSRPRRIYGPHPADGRSTRRISILPRARSTTWCMPPRASAEVRS